jgi:hypothetical protein
MDGPASGGAMGSVLTRANIAIRHKHNIEKNRMTSVCSISASSNRSGLLWQLYSDRECKAFISFFSNKLATFRDSG